MVTIKGFTDYDCPEANQIGLLSFVSVTALIVSLVICCAVVIATGNDDSKIMLLAFVTLFLEVIIGTILLIKAKQINGFHGDKHSERKVNVKRTIIAGLIILIIFISVQIVVTFSIIT